MKDITPENIKTFIRLIEEARHPIIVTHAKPDGDAIGSSAAMFHFLGLCGKEDRLLVLNDSCPRFLGFIRETIPQESLIIREENKQKAADAIARADLIICLDFHAFH
jgi:phosphoesterase RecJ-like protein